MNRRELLKKSAAAGLVAVAPLSLGAKLGVKRPTVLTTQTARTTYTVLAADVTNGYAIIGISWPASFADTTYVAVGSHLYHSSNDGSVNATVDGGNRFKTTTGIQKVVEFNSAAVTPVDADDLIDVDFIGIGQV